MKRLILSIFLLVALGFVFTSANVLANKVIVTTTRCDHGDIDPYIPDGREYVLGESFWLTIIPDPGYVVDYIHVNNIPVNIPPANSDGTVNYSISLAIDIRIHVCFILDREQFRIISTSGPNGTIDPLSSAGKLYYEGDNVCYTFIPNAGYEIDQVIVDNNPLNNPPNPYCFENLDDNHTIHVTFKEIIPDPERYNLKITYYFVDLEDNPITGNSGCNTGSYQQGDNVIIEGSNVSVPLNKPSTGPPNWFWFIYKVVADGEETVYEPNEAPKSWDFLNIKSDHTLDITFKYDDRGTIGVISIPSLTIVPNPVNGNAVITKDADVFFTHIDVVDIMGNVVMTIENPSNTIDFSNLATGGYIVRFYTDKGFTIRSIIKN